MLILAQMIPAEASLRDTEIFPFWREFKNDYCYKDNFACDGGNLSGVCRENWPVQRCVLGPALFGQVVA